MWPKALATSTEVTVEFELEMSLRTQNAILRRNMSALYTDKVKSEHIFLHTFFSDKLFNNYSSSPNGLLTQRT